ncbi:MAG: hypothetical protein K2P48_01280 [Lachnospiraceae bacterium]|nr:hypothetical protein [Lachnospiraceae bacterium]
MKGIDDMAEEQRMDQEMEHADTEKVEKKSSGGSAFEGIYEQLPNISIRSLDKFILLCVIALVAVIVFGVLKANHIF